MSVAIPEGYELLAGRGRENAATALATAVDRGFPEHAVLTHPEGYLIPLDPETLAIVEEIEAPTSKSTVEEIEAFAAEWEIDLTGASKKDEKLAAIEAEIERRAAEAESKEN